MKYKKYEKDKIAKVEHKIKMSKWCNATILTFFLSIKYSNP